MRPAHISINFPCGRAHCLVLSQANKMVLNVAPFRLPGVIEAAMEIAGLHAAQKRLQVCCRCGFYRLCLGSAGVTASHVLQY